MGSESYVSNLGSWETSLGFLTGVTLTHSNDLLQCLKSAPVCLQRRQWPNNELPSFCGFPFFWQYFFSVCMHVDIWRGFSESILITTSHRANTEHSRSEPWNFRLRNHFFCKFIFISGWYLSRVVHLYCGYLGRQTLVVHCRSFEV